MPKKVHTRKRRGRWVEDKWMSSVSAAKCVMAVGCPRCKAAATWPCFSVNGIDTPTPHEARWKAYAETL